MTHPVYIYNEDIPRTFPLRILKSYWDRRVILWAIKLRNPFSPSRSLSSRHSFTDSLSFTIGKTISRKMARLISTTWKHSIATDSPDCQSFANNAVIKISRLSVPWAEGGIARRFHNDSRAERQRGRQGAAGSHYCVNRRRFRINRQNLNLAGARSLPPAPHLSRPKQLAICNFLSLNISARSSIWTELSSKRCTVRDKNKRSTDVSWRFVWNQAAMLMTSQRDAQLQWQLQSVTTSVTTVRIIAALVSTIVIIYDYVHFKHFFTLTFCFLLYCIIFFRKCVLSNIYFRHYSHEFFWGGYVVIILCFCLLHFFFFNLRCRTSEKRW